MELYQETRRYNSTSSWSPSCNRGVARADAERERENERENEREREKEIIILLMCILRISSSESRVPFVPRGFLFHPAAAALSSRFLSRNFDVRFPLFREHLSIE